MLRKHPLPALRDDAASTAGDPPADWQQSRVRIKLRDTCDRSSAREASASRGKFKTAGALLRY